MKKSRKKRVARASKRAVCELIDRERHPNAAGLDVAAEEIVAAIPPNRPGEIVRSFSTFTSGLYELRDWLLENSVDTVAMESTGNYWVPAYQILEEAGIKVCLVNARHVKGVPGKKTDVCDAQWLQQLHAAGLLKASFRPEKDIVALRYLMRHRGQLVADSGRQVQLIQKVFNEMNIHLHHVISDLDGASGQRIIKAILAGERDPAILAEMRDQRCRTPKAKVIAALQGDYRPEYLFVLAQCQQTLENLNSQIAQLDLQIQDAIAKVSSPDPGELPPAPHQRRRLHKNSPNVNIYEQAYRFYHVDLARVDGISAISLSTFMSELGTADQILKAFPSASRFCSWLGLCPDNRISGGKILKASTRRVNNRVASVLRMAAQALNRSNSKLGNYCRKMKGRLGKAEGITATAHKLARILYSLISSNKPYDEATAFKITPVQHAKKIRRLFAQAKNLGFDLVPQQQLT